MTFPHLLVFDIPHIVGTICDYLDSKDIWHCYRVNRTWCHLFGPHRYRTVRFVNLDSSQTWHILDNAHRIHKLTVDLADAGYLVEAPCTRLKQLICVDLGYITWPSNYEYDLSWELITTWIDLDPTANALSLISRNPGLEQLTVHHRVYVAPLKPFTHDVLTAISQHQSLTRIHINLRLKLSTLMAILAHLPGPLQDLEITLDMEFTFHGFVVTTVIAPLQISQWTQLRRLAFHGTLSDYETLFLIPLLKQSPWMEDITLIPMSEASLSVVVAVLSEYCPRLQSFTMVFDNFGATRTVNRLLETHRIGLRSLTLRSSWCYTSTGLSLDPFTGTLVRALLHHSANTIEVITLSGELSPYTHGIAALLEQCPNLRELNVATGSVSLDELVRSTTWNDALLWETESTATGSTESSLILPWVCTKLETLSFFIEKPQCLSIDFDLQPLQQEDHSTNDMIEELAISVVRQIGILWKNLKSLKSLKTLSLSWDRALYQTVNTMHFERGVFYMNQIGLPSMTQQELMWMGIYWTAVTDRLSSEEAAKLNQVALGERTGYDMTRVEDCSRCAWHTGVRNQEEHLEVLWPFNVNHKRLNKAGELYSRRSLRSGAEWFDS